MDEESAQKTAYINENIIEKGYSLEELSNFIVQKLNKPIERLNFQKLKQMIEEFKDQGLLDMYETVKSKNKDVDKTKEELYFESLYSPHTYDIKVSLNEENKLMELAKNKTKLNIEVTEPLKEKTEKNILFLTKKISYSYSYKVICKELGTEVRRAYGDFEWLREQALINYPLRFIQPFIKENEMNKMLNIEKKDKDKEKDNNNKENAIIDKENPQPINNEDLIEIKKCQYLYFFLNNLLRKKILRTSPLIYDFLTLNKEEFLKYKDKINKSKYELKVTLANFKSNKNVIHCEIKPEKLIQADSYNKKLSFFSNLYTKLEKNISLIVNDFQNLETHMKEASDCFKKLQDGFMNINNDKSKNMIKICSRLNVIFTLWSQSYNKQFTYFKEDFQNVFKNLNMEIQSLENIYKSFINFKTEYEDFTAIIRRKKEELFDNKDYKNWSFQPGTEDLIPMLKENKQVAMEKMLYKENILLREEKKRIACTILFMNNEFDKLMKYQSDYVTKYFGGLKENKAKIVIGDADNLIKLFSIDTSQWT